MTTKENTFWIGVRWIFLNMFMPLLPMVIRSVIVFFSTSGGEGLKIVDLPELIYYSIFMCVICFSMFEGRESSMERILHYVLGGVIFLNLLSIVLYYYGDLKNGVFCFIVVLTILTSTITLIYRFRVCGEV